MDQSLLTERLIAIFSTILGLLATVLAIFGLYFFFLKQKTAYEIKCDWSSDVCSSDLRRGGTRRPRRRLPACSRHSSTRTSSPESLRQSRRPRSPSPDMRRSSRPLTRRPRKATRRPYNRRRRRRRPPGPRSTPPP